VYRTFACDCREASRGTTRAVIDRSIKYASSDEVERTISIAAGGQRFAAFEFQLQAERPFRCEVF